MTQTTLNHLFVPPAEIRAYMRSALGQVEERAYEIFETRGKVHGHDWDDWVQAASEVLDPVPAEVSDAGDAYIAVAAVAGYRPEELRVSTEPRRLTICGLSAGEENGPNSSEVESRHSGRFYLSFRLPAEVDTSAASAQIRQDLLELRLPKAF